MNLTDLEIAEAMRQLGTRVWRPTPSQKEALAWLFTVLVSSTWLDTYGMEYTRRDRSFDSIVAVINASEFPGALLNQEYWSAVYRLDLRLRWQVFTQVAGLPAEHIQRITVQQLHPIEYLRLLEEGVPIEYAAEAARLV